MDTKKTGTNVQRIFSLLDIVKRILIFAALVAGTAVLLRPLQLSAQNKIEKIRDTFIGQAEEYWGRKIRYGSMGPSIFGVLDIRNVLILRDDDTVLLNISRLRLSYSLFKMLGGNIFNSFQSVRIDRPVLSLDFEKDSDLAGRFASLRGQTPEQEPPPESHSEGAGQKAMAAFRDMLPDNFSFRIWNGAWELAGPAGKFTLQGVGVDASVRQNRISFQGRWDAAASLTGKGGLEAVFNALKKAAPLPVLEAAMTGKINGEYSGDSGEGSATVEIPSFSGNYIKLKPLTVSFFLNKSLLEIRKTHDKSPAAISLNWDLVSGKVQGRFEGENFTPGDIFVFSGPWQDFNSALGFRISGTAGFEREESGALTYNVDFRGAVPDGSPNAPASLTIAASGTRERVRVNTLDIRSPYGSLRFSGGMGFTPLAPYGSLSLANFSLRHGSASTGKENVTENRGLSGDFTLSTHGREITLFGDNVSSGTVTLSALDASLYQEAEGLSFAVSALRFRNMDSGGPESYGNVRLGKIYLDGTMDYNPRHLRARLRLDSFSVGDILDMLDPLAPLPAMSSLVRTGARALSVTTEVFFTTDYDHLLYNAPRIAAAYEGAANILAAASLSGTDRRFELSAGRISWAKGDAEISCSVDFSNPKDVSFSLDATHKDLTYFFEGMILEQRDINIRGSYGFQVHLVSGPGGTYSGYAHGDKIPFPSGDKFASLSFLCSLYYDSRFSWQGSIEKFELSGLTTPASSFATLRFSGSANQNGMSIPNLFYDDGKGPLAGDITLNWDPDFSFCRFRAAILGTGSRENYSLNGVYQNQKLELNVSGAGMQLSRLSAHNAMAEGRFRLSWESPASFTADAVLSSFVLVNNDVTIKASASASINNDTAVLSQLKIDYSGLVITVPNLSINRAASRVEAEAHIAGILSENPVDLSFREQARFNSTETWMDLFRGLGSLDGSLMVDTARYASLEAHEPFKVDFSGQRGKDGMSLTVTGGPQNMIRFRYSPEAVGGGSFYAALSAPSPVRGAVTGFINSKTIDAQGSDIYVDLGSLWRFIPASSPVAFPAGIVNASVRVTGPLGDPEFYGTARGTSLQILVPGYIPEPIRPVPMTVTLNGAEMTFGPVDALVGQGEGKVSAWFRFDRWIPSTFSMDIQVPPETPIPYGFDIAGVIANGLATGKLTLGMEDKVFSITGDLTAHNTEISLNANEIAAMESTQYLASDSTVTSVADITIRTGRRVEFFWPTTDFPVIQANADMGTGIRITSDTMARRFTLTGNVKLRSGEIFYLERNFYLREGTLFFKENETDFNPRISVRAEIRDQAENSPVTISMIIDNAPIKSFTPRFESSPPLSQLEIYSLLGQSPLGEGSSQRNVAISAGIDSLAQFTVIRRLQQRVRDFLGLDMLSVRTQLLQNVVLQATGGNLINNNPNANSTTNTNPNAAKDPNLDKPYRAGNYFDNTTVFIGKYFGSAMFGQALLSLKYDENKQTMGGLSLEPEIGLEMRNPLFDIRFNALLLHPENWFINDVSVSLIWRKSF